MLDLNDVIRIVVTLTMPDSVLAQLVYHYLVVAGSGADPATVLSAIATDLGGSFGFIEQDISDQVASSELEMFQWDFALDQFDGVASQALGNIAGTNANEMLPHGVAPVVKFFTETSRRQGRKFIPGYTEDTQDEGTLTGVVVTRLVTFATSFNDDIVSDGVTISPGNFNVDPLSSLFETFAQWSNSSAIATIIGYQRRRKAGVGI